MEITPLTFSEQIKLQRQRLNISQDDLAKSAGVSRNYISMLERGYVDGMTVRVLSSVCDALNMVFEFSANLAPRSTAETEKA